MSLTLAIAAISAAHNDKQPQSTKSSSDVSLEVHPRLPPPGNTAGTTTDPAGPSDSTSPVSADSTPAEPAQPLQPSSPGESAATTGPGGQGPPVPAGKDKQEPKSSADNAPGTTSSSLANTAPQRADTEPGMAVAEAARTSQQPRPQPDQSGLPKSPITFDDLVPLLTSQHRTSSSNNDALMDLFDAYTRQGGRHGSSFDCFFGF